MSKQPIKTDHSTDPTLNDIHNNSFPLMRTKRNHEEAKLVSDLTSITFTDESLTKQSMAKDCDINNILKVFENSGVVTHENRHTPSYGDFEHLSDFQTNLNNVIEAQNLFMSLPAHVRTRFANDPGNYLDFMSDKANYDEAVKLGLVKPLSSEPSASFAPQAKKEAALGGGTTQPPSGSPDPLKTSNKADLLSRLDKILSE